MNVKYEGNITLVDERFNMIISGLPTFSICRIDLCIYYSWSECPLHSYAIFRADGSGNIDLDTMKPIKGSYKSVDSMGLFYGLKDARGNYKRRKERDFTKEYITCNYIIKCQEEEHQETIVRYFTSETIQCLHIRQEFRGEYYYHIDKETRDCVILLGGSEGIINPILPIAACLANKGYQVLALQYFDPESQKVKDSIQLPGNLECIPLEYIDKAIDWLIERNEQNKVFIMGCSKGAELALLAASKNKNIKKVVAIAPSAYVWQGIPSQTSSWSTSSWSSNGKPIPYMPFTIVNTLDILKNNLFGFLNLPQGFFLSYEISRILSFNKEQSRIKVENIEGDICLIAGGKDTMWNSTKAIQLIRNRLDQNVDSRKIYKDQYHIYHKAGHCFYPPFIFTTDHVYGSSKYANYKANEDSWKQIIDFL
ncbi:acyl-CoA thioesterase/bile acid-CoA:amino acid N-acyltransferase family protein [Anaeromicropila herbilytica]|uniref:Acyl-CoA thioesterase n=1 Tax=Anaeromicropila herbilytica TaxID=2785025 RepID=A0A7R7ELQ4_9FIRM|nr:acyl-CoA thioesterase/bile acid-CoA:amino acid N-acyltransferase family protein [Anaeromicropila herbilytica]BCN31063.1 acyl-CoA thioesterase [Anaeromicropila herbilytica]